MSYLEKLQEEVNAGELDHVYSRSQRLMVEIGLGSGIRLEVVYNTLDDQGTDNIQSATLYEHGTPKLLDEEDIKLLVKAEII